MSPLRRLPLALLALALALAPACGSRSSAPPDAPRPAAAAIGAVPGALGATTDGGAPLPFDPALKTGKLANGLTYYVRKNEKPAKRAELWLVVDAGSVLEDDDQRGVAHFVEHMAFNGTKKYAKQEIVDWLEKTGMKFGADVNAHTSFDETVYQIQVPTDDGALIDHGLDVLHEWAQGVAFDPAEVEKERGVVLEERRLGRGAEGRLLDQIIPAALPGSRYGVRLPIGTEESLKSVKPETLVRFYRDWYRPDLMAVIVVGDLDPVAAARQIEARFGDLATPATPRPRPTVAVPPHDQPVTMAVTDPELPVTGVAVASKQPHRIVRSEGDYRASFVDNLFTSMMNQRLTELARKPGSPFIGAAVGNTTLMRPIEVWFQGAVVKGDRSEEALTALAAEVARVGKHGFTDGEIARAKAELVQRYEVMEREKDKSESRGFAEELVRVYLTGESAPGVEAELALIKKHVPAITADQLKAIAARAASKENRLVLAAGNSRGKLPEKGALLAAVEAGGAAGAQAYVDDAIEGPLVATPPLPSTIKSRRTIAELGVTEWTLSNGIRVVLKPTDFQNDSVVLTAFSLGGSSLAKDADYVAAAHAAEIVAAGGAGKWSATQLDKALSGTGVQIGGEIDRYDQSLSGSAQPAHLETLFQLVYLRLTGVRKDEAAIEAWRENQIEARARQLDDPNTVFTARVREALTSKHPRTRLLTGVDFARLDADRALAFYRDRLAHLRGLTLVVVGSFSLEAIEPLVLTYVGGLPAGGKAERWRDVRIRRPRGPVTVDVAQGVEPRASVQLIFHRDAPWSREAEHELEALASALSIRLREELREGLGGTYGVGVWPQFQREAKPVALMTIQFSAAPEAVDHLVAEARKVIEAFKQDGPPATVVDKIKQTERRERETRLKQNGFWLDHLVSSYRYRDEPRAVLADDKLTDRLTVDRLRSAARRYLGRDQVLGILRPAATPPSATPPSAPPRAPATPPPAPAAPAPTASRPAPLAPAPTASPAVPRAPAPTAPPPAPAAPTPR
jgi:zinc protease